MNGCSDGSSMTALVSPSNSTGSTTMLFGGAAPRLEWMRVYSARHVVEQNALLLERALADQPFAERGCAPADRRRCA